MNAEHKDVSQLQETISKNVKRLRLRQGLSQEEFADRCGYHRTYIGSIERAERNITISTLESLAKALGVGPDELLRDHG